MLSASALGPGGHTFTPFPNAASNGVEEVSYGQTVRGADGGGGWAPGGLGENTVNIAVDMGENNCFIKVRAPDRRGLLQDILKALQLLPMELHRAAVTTDTDPAGVVWVTDIFELTMINDGSVPRVSSDEVKRRWGARFNRPDRFIRDVRSRNHPFFTFHLLEAVFEPPSHHSHALTPTLSHSHTLIIALSLSLSHSHKRALTLTTTHKGDTNHTGEHSTFHSR